MEQLNEHIKGSHVKISQDIIDLTESEPGIEETKQSEVLMETNEFMYKLCDYECEDKDAFNNHNSNEHDTIISDKDIENMGGKVLTAFFCKVCKFITDNGEDLKTHDVNCQTSPTVTKYKCEQCEFENEDKEILKKHIDSPHCNICKISFITKKFLEEHINKEHKIQPFACDLCKFVTEKEDNLNEHKSYVHEETFEYKNSKDITGKKMEQKEFINAKETKEVKQINQCNVCNFKALNDTDLQFHKQTVHESQLLILRALQDLTARIGVLTNDVFNLKVNSIIIEKDVYQVVKNEMLKK